MKNQEVIQAKDEIEYQEQIKEFEFTCFVDILKWRNEKAYENAEEGIVVAKVIGQIAFGQKKISVVYKDKTMKLNLLAKKAIKEATFILQTELDYIIEDYYS